MQSFKENEITDPYKAHEIGLKWADKMFGDKYQYVLSTHIDKGHIHNHVVINSVSLSGKSSMPVNGAYRMQEIIQMRLQRNTASVLFL